MSNTLLPAWVSDDARLIAVVVFSYPAFLVGYGDYSCHNDFWFFYMCCFDNF